MEMINLLKKLNEISNNKILLEQEGRKMPLPGLSDYEKDWGGTDPHDSSGLDAISTAVGWKDTPKEEVGIKAKVYFPKIMSFDVKSRYETGRKGLERRISVEKLKQDDLDQWYFPVPADMKPAELKNHVKYLERYFGPKGDIVKASSDDTPSLGSDDRPEKIKDEPAMTEPSNVVPFKPKSSGMGGGGDDHNTRHYDQAIDFYGMFDSGELDKEEMDQENGVFRGYQEDENGEMKLVAYFKFDDPENIDDEDPGEGWFEGEDGPSILDTPRGMREDSDLTLLRKLAGLKESFPAMGGGGTANMNISAANGKELAGIIKDIVGGGSDTSVSDEPALSATPSPVTTTKSEPSMRDMMDIFSDGDDEDVSSDDEFHNDLGDHGDDDFLEDDMNMYDSSPRPRIKQDPVRQFGDIDNNHQNGLVGHNVRETTEEELFSDYKKFVSEATKKCCCKESGKTKCPVHMKKRVKEHFFYYNKEDPKHRAAWMDILRNNGMLLGNIEKDQLDIELCKVAVSNNGLALKYVPDNLKTREICMAAIRNNSGARKYCPTDMVSSPNNFTMEGKNKCCCKESGKTKCPVHMKKPAK